MAQGGDPTGRGDGGPGYTIACECYLAEPPRAFPRLAEHGQCRTSRHRRLAVLPHFVPTPQLDGKHTVFGRVIRGMDVLAKIQRRDPRDKEAPRPDKILEAKVTHKRPHEYKPQKMPD